MIARPAERLSWLTERSGYVPLPDAKGIEAVAHGVVRGMVVLDGFTATMAQIHVALDTSRAAPTLLRPAFEYPFLQLGLRVLVTMIDASNTRAVNLARGLGFTEAYRIRDGMAAGVDLILFEMRREHCRHLQEAH